MGKSLFSEPVFPHLNVECLLFLDHFVLVALLCFT